VREPHPTDASAPSALADALTALASAQADDAALIEFELAADANGEPIPDRATATFVTWALRAAGATRVVELGGGTGGLSWWLAGAVGAEGEVHVVTDPASGEVAAGRLRRAARFDRIVLHTPDAAEDSASPDHLAAIDGELDAIVVREVTPRLADAWGALVARVRPGGVIVVGAVLTDGPPTGRAAAVVRDALEDPELWTSLVPLGRGLLVALKARSDLAGAATDRLW
jgi:predicted O-methyltransferase YrrM